MATYQIDRATFTRLSARTKWLRRRLWRCTLHANVVNMPVLYVSGIGDGCCWSAAMRAAEKDLKKAIQNLKRGR